MRGGLHQLASKISLTSTDKGMSITAYQNEKPVISGGQKLTGFVDEGDGLFSKALAQPSGLDLFVGEARVLVGQGGYYDPSIPTRSGWLKAQSSAESHVYKRVHERIRIGFLRISRVFLLQAGRYPGRNFIANPYG